MTRTAEWPRILLDLPKDAWTQDNNVPHTRIRIAGCVLDVHGLEVAVDADGVQGAVLDGGRESLLLDIYDPEAHWETWHGFGRNYALYATPSADQTSEVAADIPLERDAWSGYVPEFEERDRKLVSTVVAGHCALHLEARRVVGPDQEFVAFPEDKYALTALAGWDGPYPTVNIDGDDFVLFAYPHGE